MDNGVPNLAAGKRRRDGFPIEEDIKDNLKVPRQWYGPQRADDGMKEGFQNNLNFQGLSVENLIRMQQQQKSEMAGMGPVSSPLNMQQRVMAAAALQDLRGINESSKMYYQPQVQQHLQYSMQQQQQPPPQALQQIWMPTDLLAGSMREPSPSGQRPQSPLPLPPPPPFIRTPPLYTEADLHNGSPTSSSSGPYSSLQNMVGPPCTSQPSNASIQLPELENDSCYASLLHASQNTFLSQQSRHNSHDSQLPAQHQRGHSPHSGTTQLSGQGSQIGGIRAYQGCQGTSSCPSTLRQQENGHGVGIELLRHPSQNTTLQQPASLIVQNGAQSGLQSGSVQQHIGHPTPNAPQCGLPHGTVNEHSGHALPDSLQNGMQNGNTHQQDGHLLRNGMSSGAQCGNTLTQGDSSRISASTLLQGGHTLPNKPHHQQHVHSAINVPPSGSQIGTMHQQTGHRVQDGMVQHQGGLLLQNGDGSQHSGQTISNGVTSNQVAQGGSNCLTQQQQIGLPPLPRDFQGMQQVTGPWYPPTVSETQPNASNARLQRQDLMAVTSVGGNLMFSHTRNEFGSQRGLATLPPQGGFRDLPFDQDVHLQPEGQSSVQSSGSVKGCGASSSRMGILPQQTDNHGRRLLQGNFCAPSSSGADTANLCSPAMVANGLLDDPFLLQRSVMCPPKITRSYTKVYKLGSITRAVDVNRFSNYTDLRCELARMFNLEGQIDHKLGWQLVFTDNEDDLLLVGDDPWDEFVRNVRGIRILTPAEWYFYTNSEDKCATINPTGGNSAPK